MRFVVLLCLCLLLGACNGINSKYHTKISQEKIVEILNIRKNLLELLEVDILFQAPKKTKIYYTFEWLDDESERVKSYISDEQVVILPDEGQITVKKMILDIRATNFKLIIHK